MRLSGRRPGHVMVRAAQDGRRSVPHGRGGTGRRAGADGFTTHSEIARVTGVIGRGWRPGERVPGVMPGGVFVLRVHRAGLSGLLE